MFLPTHGFGSLCSPHVSGFWFSLIVGLGSDREGGCLHGVQAQAAGVITSLESEVQSKILYKDAARFTRHGVCTKLIQGFSYCEVSEASS